MEEPDFNNPKPRRNAPCWCGSGQKYKRCHLNRATQQPIQPWEAGTASRHAFSARLCLAPDAWKAGCSGQIIKAHTVSRSSSLSKIARHGHVYAFVPTIENLERSAGVLKPQLVGIRLASTFTGFCSAHDNSIFAPIEKRPFVATQEQCFLLAYRAFAREVFTKRALASNSDVLRSADRGRPRDAQVMIQQFAAAAEMGSAAGLRDNDYRKSQFDRILTSQDFQSVRAYVIELQSAPPVMCSGGFCPEQDFDGNQLQDLGDLARIPELVTISSFHGGNHGFVVLSWIADDERAARALVASLARTPDSKLGDALLRLAFEFCENVHMQPPWWEQLTPASQTALVCRMAASANPFQGRMNGCLADDGMTSSPWSVRQRFPVGFAE